VVILVVFEKRFSPVGMDEKGAINVLGSQAKGPLMLNIDSRWRKLGIATMLLIRLGAEQAAIV
jgi:hypothetical protein